MKQDEVDFEFEVQTIQTTLEALEKVRLIFEAESSKKGISKASLSRKIGRDPSYVSRVLNGRVSNVNFQTLARMLLAMDHWPLLEARPMSEMNSPANFRVEFFDPEPASISGRDEWTELVLNKRSEETRNLGSDPIVELSHG